MFAAFNIRYFRRLLGGVYRKKENGSQLVTDERRESAFDKAFSMVKRTLGNYGPKLATVFVHVSCAGVKTFNADSVNFFSLTIAQNALTYVTHTSMTAGKLSHLFFLDPPRMEEKTTP